MGLAAAAAGVRGRKSNVELSARVGDVEGAAVALNEPSPGWTGEVGWPHRRAKRGVGSLCDGLLFVREGESAEGLQQAKEGR